MKKALSVRLSVVVVASSLTDSKFGVNSDYPFVAARVG